MAPTSAENQERSRERHLGLHGTRERTQRSISVQAKAQLGRPARHHGYTVTKMIEDLVAAAEQALLDRLPRRQHVEYLDSHLNHSASRKVPARPKPKAAKKRQSAS